MTNQRRREQPRQAHPYEWRQPARTALYPEPYYPDEAYDDDADWDDERPRRVRLITPWRVLLFLLAVACGLVALYGFLDRTAMQITIIIVGLGLLGVALLLLSLSLARAAAQLGRQGSGGRAMVAALFGGLCILGAAGALSGAIVLGMLTL
jgi:hypothetical protein